MQNIQANQSTNMGARRSSDDKQLLKGDFDMFVKLLTTQLTNQDPTSPMDSSAFTQQIVSLTMASQAVKTNGHLEELVEINRANSVSNSNNTRQNSLDTASMINMLDKKVVVDGSAAYMDETGNDLNFFFSLPVAAKKGEISITNSEGEEIFSQKIFNLTRGLNSFSWNGQDSRGNYVNQGKYSMAVTLTDNENTEVNYDIEEKLSGIKLLNDRSYFVVGDKPIDIKQIKFINN